jgi:hypothetical protein
LREEVLIWEVGGITDNYQRGLGRRNFSMGGIWG